MIYLFGAIERRMSHYLRIFPTQDGASSMASARE